jgi:hypothetical protein
MLDESEKSAQFQNVNSMISKTKLVSLVQIFESGVKRAQCPISHNDAQRRTTGSHRPGHRLGPPTGGFPPATRRAKLALL